MTVNIPQTNIFYATVFAPYISNILALAWRDKFEPSPVDG